MDPQNVSIELTRTKISTQELPVEQGERENRATDLSTAVIGNDGPATLEAFKESLDDAAFELSRFMSLNKTIRCLTEELEAQDNNKTAKSKFFDASGPFNTPSMIAFFASALSLPLIAVAKLPVASTVIAVSLIGWWIGKYLEENHVSLSSGEKEFCRIQNEIEAKVNSDNLGAAEKTSLYKEAQNAAIKMRLETLMRYRAAEERLNNIYDRFSESDKDEADKIPDPRPFNKAVTGWCRRSLWD